MSVAATVALTFAVALGSALLPVVNAELYLLGVAASGAAGGWVLALAAAAGQTVGKLALFLVARGALELPWLVRWKRQRPARPGGRRQRATVVLARWSAAAQRHRGGAVAVVGASASVGVPPLLATSVLAGTTSMRASTFAVTCLLGRWVRFAAVLAAPTLVTG